MTTVIDVFALLPDLIECKYPRPPIADACALVVNTIVLRESSDESDDSADSEYSSDDDTASAGSDGGSDSDESDGA